MKTANHSGSGVGAAPKPPKIPPLRFEVPNVGVSMRHVPWHVKGVRPEAREVARDAARRSGLSVGEWLNSLIIDAVGDEDSAAGRYREPAPFNPPARSQPTGTGDAGFAAIRKDIDELKWQINRLSLGNARSSTALDPGDWRGAQLAESIARIERQLGGLNRIGSTSHADPDRNLGVEDALAEIAARQEFLDAESTDTRPSRTPSAGHEMSRPQVDPAVFEQQLRDIGVRINACDGMAAEISRTIERGAPKRAIEAIEEQLRRLTAQLESVRPSPQADQLVDLLRRDIAEIGHRINDATPPRAVAAIAEQIAALSTQVANLQQPQRTEDIVEALHQHFAELRGPLKDAVQPIEEIAKVWRQDLVEISAALGDAMPTSAIAALEREVRALGERLEAHRGAAAATSATADFEQALAGIRDRLQALTPAEELAELSHAVKLLSRKADAIVSESAAPEMMQQLEHAIGALQRLAAQIASQDVVAGLSHDIKALGDKIDRNGRQAADSDFVNTLEQRLAEIAEAVGRSRPAEGASIPANFDAIIKSLADRLEATQIPAAEQGALKNLERRIVTLVDKLENSEARLDRQEGTDRGMNELLAQLKELRAQNENKLLAIEQQFVTSAAEAISGPAESIRRDVASLKEIQTSADRRTQDTFEAVYGTIEQVVDRLATIEDGLRDGPYADQPPLAQMMSVPRMVAEAPTIVPSAAPMGDRATAAPTIGRHGKAQTGILSVQPAATVAPARQPVVSDLPPDSPLEPGSGARRVRVVANAIDRIAASEAVNGPAKSAETATPVRADFVAAARRAAQAVASEQEETPAVRPLNSQPGKLLWKLKPRIKSVVLGVSVIMLVLGALRLALDLFHNPEASTSAPSVTRMDEAVQPGSESIPSIPQPTTPPDQPPTGKGANLESPTLSGPHSASAFLDETTLGQTPTSGVLPDFAALAVMPRPAVAQTPAVPDPAVSSPIRNPLLQGPASRDAVSQPVASPAVLARDLTQVPLPLTMGGKGLIAAASAGEPGASYEVAIRFAEGRNVPQDHAMAAAWFERAARSGLAPAQFRLGSMYEKGLGIKRDISEARRLYLAAADKGNAKAMHNLAVLYAEGLDGKPDYAVASQWFRKAAAHGVVDSQYNLAILYARGVGVERNSAESYKWFALAAKGGDKDATKKRDEIATRLDPKQLEGAKLNVESFVAEPQPDEATATKAPAGGWDQVVAAATTKSKAVR